MAITIALCEDEAVQIAALQKLLTQWSADKPFALNIHEYASAESFLFSYADKPCDLLLLDIEMKGLGGIELAKKLRAEGDMLPIIFVTGYSDYMGEGYEVEALHYLLKPVAPEKLFAVLDRYIKKQKREQGLLLQCEDKTMHILPDAILYCEASGKKTQIYLKDGGMLVCNKGISFLAKDFEGGFIAPHRSYLVNLRYIYSIGRTEIILDNGTSLPLSRRLYKDINEIFIRYYRESP